MSLRGVWIRIQTTWQSRGVKVSSNPRDCHVALPMRIRIAPRNDMFLQSMKKITKILNLLLPYSFIIIGVILLLITPLSFYSNKNLNVPTSLAIIDQVVVARNSEQLNSIGGDIKPKNLPKSSPVIPLVKKTPPTPPFPTVSGQVVRGGETEKLTAKSAVVIDVKSENILFDKKIKNIRSLASITKLMSAMVLLDLPIDWSVSTTITLKDGEEDSYVYPGEKFTLQDLWNIALVGSSNRAVNALIRESNIEKENFIKLMNRKAQELNLASLKFVEPTGLSEKNTGNAIDAAKLLKEALHFERIYNTVKIGEYYARPLNQKKLRRVWSTNWLLTNWVPNDFSAENIAGKTGYIEQSGYNFVVSLKNKNNHEIIIAILGADSHEKRYEEARDLGEWIFDNYVWPGEVGYDELVE